jgi:hypothetical protein
MFNLALCETNEIYPKETTGVSKHDGDKWYSNHTHTDTDTDTHTDTHMHEQKILHPPLITFSWVVIQSSKTLIWIRRTGDGPQN